jgi:hypothetical protein
VKHEQIGLGIQIFTSLPHLSFENSMWPNDPVEEVFAHMHIHSRERVIQQVDISVLIHGPGQADSLLLTTTQVDALVGRGKTHGYTQRDIS